MPLPYNLLLVQVLGFLTVSYSFANAAIVPSSLSAFPNVVPSTKLNVSTYLNDTTHCLLPVPYVVPVSLETCQPALRRTLLAPEVDYLRLYEHNMSPIMIIGGTGCFVSLDRQGRGGNIVITKRTVVAYALQVLQLCQNFGHGGWAHIDMNDDWIVIVSGDRANGEPGVGRDGLSLDLRAR